MTEAFERYDRSAVPGPIADQTQMQQLQAHVRSGVDTKTDRAARGRMEVTGFRSTFIDEFYKTSPIDVAGPSSSVPIMATGDLFT